MRFETWDLRYWGTRESWRILAKIKICQIWRNTAATGLCIPDVEQHRCNSRTVYGSFRSEDSRCGVTIRSEREVNTFQIWSNTPTISWLIRSWDSIIQIWSNIAATGRCTGQFVSLCITPIFVFCVAFITWHRLHLTLRIAFILHEMYYKRDIC